MCRWHWHEGAHLSEGGRGCQPRHDPAWRTSHCRSACKSRSWLYGVRRCRRPIPGRCFQPRAKHFARFVATNALDHQADIAKVQEWLGHANIATTRIYDDRRRTARRSKWLISLI